MADSSWRARVSGVETVANLAPIFGWEDQPLVSLVEATKKLPVKNIGGHAQVAAEAGEDYKFSHPDDPRTEDQLGAVHLYSQAWPVAEHSLYAVLNETLSESDRGKLVIWFLFIKLLMTALVAEPMYVGVVWRGVKADIGDQYPKGKKFRWWRFSSCTEDGDVLHNPMFLGDSGKRTLFAIDCKTGIKIQHLSAYTAEAEVLLAAGTRFVVANTINPAPDLTVVNLKEVGSGLPLPEAVPPEPEIEPEPEPEIEPEPEPEIEPLQIYVMGGVDGSYLNTVEVYNPQAQTWTALLPMSSKRYYHTAVVVGSQIYVMGGAGLNTVEVYNPQAQTWTALPPMSSKRGYHTAVVVGSQIYVMGGYDGSSYLNTAEVYNPQAQTWTALPPMSSKRYRHTAVVVGSQIYVMGGLSGSSYLNTVEVYNPQAQTWTALPPMSSERCNHTAVVVGSQIYVMGGVGLNTAEVYNPQAQTWTALPPMSSKRCEHTAVVVGSQIYVMGGVGLNTAEVYNPQAQTWTALPPMSSERFRHTAVSV
eukprot:COSAG04_NODE_1154_length_8051_cov_26.213531_4_plen_531_part_00